MREAFVWTASIGFILVLLLNPILMANSNSRLIIESLENSIENLAARSTLNNILFELTSSLLDYCRLVLGKNNGYLEPTLLNVEVNELATGAVNHYLQFLSEQGYPNSKIQFMSEIFESSSDTHFEPVLLRSKHQTATLYPEGAVGMLIYPSISISRGAVKANADSSFTILCPYRMFLIQRVEEQIHRKATALIEAQISINASLDIQMTSLTRNLEEIFLDFARMTEKILISLRTSLRMATLEKSENETQLDVFLDTEIFDLQPKAYFIDSGSRSQLGSKQSYSWTVIITHSPPREEGPS